MKIDPARRFAIHRADWIRDGDALRAVRRAVFIVEQRIPENLEWDEFDPVCPHALAAAVSGTPIGCGRLLPDGHVGRLAVLSPWRDHGVGSALLLDLMELARGVGHARVLLNSQTQAMPFYARHGFFPVGDEFMEAGIPHRTMARTLD
ncbi:MAG: GNAT family N-acetyltransferase [Betaproteobacteria bacterium]